MGFFVTYLIPAAVLLGVLIFVHELGHFIVAKMCGVRVLKFSLGFGPKLAGRKIGETEYILSLLPLGGYVKPLGENPEEPISDDEKPYSLNYQSIPKRFAILAAGSLFNIVFAGFVFTCLYMAGVPKLKPLVGDVQPSSPAHRAGLQAGDLIVGVNGQDIELWDELSYAIQDAGGSAVSIRVNREGTVKSFTITPEKTETTNVLGEKSTVYRIGIEAQTTEDAVIHKRYSPPVAVWKGVQDTVKWSVLTLKGLYVIVKNPVERRKDLGGPILIGKLAGDFAQVSIMSFVVLMAMISVNLGVLNLLPIPILDGGHILFLCIEAIKGSPINVRKLEIAQQIGLAILLMLMIFVFYNDITRFVSQ